MRKSEVKIRLFKLYPDTVKRVYLKKFSQGVIEAITAVFREEKRSGSLMNAISIVNFTTGLMGGPSADYEYEEYNSKGEILFHRVLEINYIDESQTTFQYSVVEA